MSDQTLFDEPTQETQTPSEAAPADQQTAAPAQNPYDNLLQGIKTDDGRQKYATVSDALNSIGPKEQHIMTLESENSTLRERLDSLKADFEAFKATSEANRNTDTGKSQTETANTAIDVDTLVSEVTQKLSAQEQQKQAQTHLMSFRDKLVSTYGQDKAKDVYVAKLQGTGLPEAQVKQIIATNPEAAWKFLGLDTTQTVERSSVPSSTRNSTAQEQRPEEPTYKFRPAGKSAPGTTMAQMRAEKMKELGLS